MHDRFWRQKVVECESSGDCPEKTRCAAYIQSPTSKRGRCVFEKSLCSEYSDCGDGEACVRRVELEELEKEGVCVSRTGNTDDLSRNLRNHDGWCQFDQGRQGHKECKADSGCFQNIDTGDNQGACAELEKNEGFEPDGHEVPKDKNHLTPGSNDCRTNKDCAMRQVCVRLVKSTYKDIGVCVKPRKNKY